MKIRATFEQAVAAKRRLVSLQRDIERDAQELFHRALRITLETTASHVRVETGMSVNSIIPPASSILSITIGYPAPWRMPYRSYSDSPLPPNKFAPWTSPDAGQAASKYEYKAAQGRYYFSFTINVRQWDIHEEKWDAMYYGFTEGRRVLEEGIAKWRTKIRSS